MFDHQYLLLLPQADSCTQQTSRALFRLLLLPPALDRPCDLLVLLGHLREAVLPQALRPGAVPLRRFLLARLLRLVLGRHRLPSRGGGAGACVPSGNVAAQRCPGGGRSPAPASVYTKSCPLSSLGGERGTQAVEFFARNRDGHDAPPKGALWQVPARP